MYPELAREFRIMSPEPCAKPGKGRAIQPFHEAPPNVMPTETYSKTFGFKALNP